MIMRLQTLLWIVRFIVIGLSPVASCSSVLVPHSKVVAAFFGSRKPFVNDTRSSRVLGTLVYCIGSIDWRKRVCLCVKAQSRCLFRLFPRPALRVAFLRSGKTFGSTAHDTAWLAIDRGFCSAGTGDCQTYRRLHGLGLRGRDSRPVTHGRATANVAAAYNQAGGDYCA
jgi:hypothetical protein